MRLSTGEVGLLTLSNISKDGVYGADKHAVAQRVTGVLDDGNNVGTVSGHANQITTGAVRELDGIDTAGGTDDISNVRDGGTAGTTNVENLRARANVNLVQTTQDTGSQLGTEGVPHTVLDLGDSTILAGRALDRDALLAVNSLTGGQVLGDQQILLTTTGDEDTGVTVGLLEKENVG